MHEDGLCTDVELLTHHGCVFCNVMHTLIQRLCHAYIIYVNEFRIIHIVVSNVANTEEVVTLKSAKALNYLRLLRTHAVL